MRSGNTGTVLGSSSRWRGELECSEDLLIEGHFEGSIRQSAGVLTVGENARVSASISAGDVLVVGRVHGDVHATDRVALQSSAVVMGNVFAQRFSMEEGAVLRGQVVPDRKGAIDQVPQPPAEAPAATGAPVLTEASVTVAPPVAFVPPAKLAVVPAVPMTNAQLTFETPVSPVTRSGRQLPSALAAFAAGGRQHWAEDENAQGEFEPAKTSSWRVRTQEN